jgi:HTH-type transcriptional regulator, transcriptional repressor of NAD biosynthesis genes
MEKGAANMNATLPYGLGVVIGKFLPPHKGHRFLIETALSRCRRVVVIVCGKAGDPIPGALRAGWLRELIPAAEVMLIDDRYDENDSRIWAQNTIRWLGRAPDAVFTSEPYGDAYAAHLGCVHISVDPARVMVPCSGTAVRDDPFAMWNHIDPPVRAWYVKRVVVLGAESTGTTTLARDLAAALDTQWVPEFGRDYSAEKMARGESTWRTGEFLTIAREQTRREDAAARRANRILICDTNAFATRLWHRRYMGFDCPELAKLAATCRADLYLLTGNEIPFAQDGLRDGEHIRHEMHRWFEVELSCQPCAWRLLRGNARVRLAQALGEIRLLAPFSAPVADRKSGLIS